MPPKLTADQNSLFLYTIIKTADLKSIQWQQVGKQFNLSNQAAYMRFSRLRSVMEKELTSLEAKLALGIHLTPSKKVDNNSTPKPTRSPIKKAASKSKSKPKASAAAIASAVFAASSANSNSMVHNGGVIGMPIEKSFDSTVSTLDLGYKSGTSYASSNDYKEENEVDVSMSDSSSPTKKRRLDSEDVDILSEGSYGVYTD